MKKLKILVLLALLACVLFVQEEALSFLPNIQFTFLLLICYVDCLGFRKTSLIVFVHVLLDNLVMGSLNPIVVIPMLVGYIITILIKKVYHKDNVYIIGLLGSLGAIVYSLSFLIANALFLEIDIWAYFLADIPFTLILMISTYLSIIWLYKPIIKIINQQYQKYLND